MFLKIENGENMKNSVKFVLQIWGCLIGSIILGYFLLVIVYLIPTQRMRENVAVVSNQVSDEGSYYQWAKGYKNAQIDTYTDASLYLNAMYPNTGKPFIDALNSPRLLYGDDNNEESVVLLAQETKAETQEIQYGRYWHGSLIFLKPLLYIFDLADIRVLGMIVQMALLFVAVSGFTKRELSNVLVGFFAAVIFINPVTMSLGFCFSVEYILMLIMLNIVIYFHEELMEGNRYYFFFLINGILFVYFNELSFPMIGLGFPLVAYLALSKDEWKICLKKELIYTFFWGLGYSVMWFGKWILAWMITGYNYFAEALGQAERYTSENATWEAVNPSIVDRIIKNVNVYMKWPYFITVFIIIIAIIIMAKRRKIKNMGLGIIPFIIPIFMPIAIIIVLGNGYSYVHYWFTHRLLAISVFAVISMMGLSKNVTLGCKYNKEK